MSYQKIKENTLGKKRESKNTPLSQCYVSCKGSVTTLNVAAKWYYHWEIGICQIFLIIEENQTW